MKSLQIYLFLFLSVFALGACIQNDIPYPYIKGEITAFEVEGQTGDAEINKNSRTIVVEVGDEVDIEELRITRFVVNEEATYSIDEQYCVSPNKFPSAGFSALADLPAGADTRVDFSKTVPVLLRTYQDYQWMITVKQTIERIVEVDIEELRITRFVVNEEATYSIDEQYCVSPNKFPSAGFSALADLPAGADTRVDFSKTVPVLLRTYQDYQWMITVKQTIERIVEVENQALPAIIDDKNHTVLVYVSQKQDLSAVKITKMILGGSKATITPDPSTVTNFRRPQEFVVNRFDKEELWTVDVVRTTSTGTTGSADVWATRATLNGGMKQGTTPRVEYRKKSEDTWTVVPETDVKLESGTTFSTTLTGLQDGTDYVWRVVVEEVPSTESGFTTEKIQEIPNLNFDTWSQNPTGTFKKSWYPNADGSNSFWATGNDGVTSSLAGSRDSSTRPEEKSVVNGKAAYMVTLGSVPLVGVAAGNLFIGDYKTNAQSPKDSPKFGRSFTGARPTGLKGWYKYTSKPVDYVGNPDNLKNDECHIYLRLWDDKDNEIGYGEFIGKETVTQYTQFRFDVTYTNKTAKPAKITIVATSSHYGGDFTGMKVTGSVGVGSELWVDEFELLYE